MSLRIAARLARRELRGGLRGFRVFLACLALGVAAIAAVGTVRASIEEGLRREGATILGGDAEIELTYRFASDAERVWMDGVAVAVSEIVDFRSMAVVGDGETAERGLTQIKAVDDIYPLLGRARLDPDMPLPDALAGKDGFPGAVMDPVLVDRLALMPGDMFRLGSTEFVLMARLNREPDNATGGFTLGPRTIVLTRDLAASGLLQPGTLFETQYRMRLAPGTDPDAVKAEAENVIEGAGYRWRDAREGAPGVRRFVDRLSAFLVLTGLAGLAVGGVGISSAVRAYLDEKRPVIATLKSLGAESRTIFQVYFLQIATMALIGLTIGLVLGAALPMIVLPLLGDALPVPSGSGLQPAALAQAALYGALAAMLFTIWPLARSEDIRAATLFRDAALGQGGWPRPFWIMVTLVLLVALVLAAALLTDAIWLTLGAAGGIIGAFMALVLAAWGARALARRLARARWVRGRSVLRLALGAVGGPGGEATSVVLSLGLGLSVLAAVGQIDANLRGSIARDLPKIAPAFFMVDIQTDQLEGFHARLDNDPAVSRVETAPMLRGVITRINDRPAEEVAGGHWVIRGDRGLTYAAAPPEGTKITAGEWWPRDYSGPPQVSFAAEEAAEIGLKLGDTITVNILGRDVTATITSFREVNFETAGIGFVMSMDPAAISGAPHSHIATIYAQPEAEAAILRDLATAFPNITAIRVRDAIDRVTEVLGAIAAAVTYGALATLLTGGIVLIGAAAAGERSRTYEAAILKTLGAARGAILANFALRSAFLGLAAGAVAVAAGAAAGWAVTTFVMESTYRFEPASALMIVLGGVALTVLTGLLFAWRPLSARPAQILRARE